MKNILIVAALVVSFTTQSFALSEDCARKLVLNTASLIVKKNLEKPADLDLHPGHSHATQLSQGRFDRNILVNTVVVTVWVKDTRGNYAYSQNYEVRGGRCATAKIVSPIQKSGLYLNDNSSGAFGGD